MLFYANRLSAPLQLYSTSDGTQQHEDLSHSHDRKPAERKEDVNIDYRFLTIDFGTPSAKKAMFLPS